MDEEQRLLAYEKLDATIESITARTDYLREMRRARDIQHGVDPDAPTPTVEQVRAETIALRAQNDQEHAQMIGRWRTHD